jgi:Domain of unknown function (DUF397)
MTAPQRNESAWFKSTRSAGNGACVEVTFANDTVGVRDSKDPQGPTLDFAPESWTAFVKSIREGHLHR